MGIWFGVAGAWQAYYHRRGLYTISLNTQMENVASHKLYERFGFQPSGPAAADFWVLDIV
ncbi:MAG: hypothetical protein R3D55_06015 [Chloroflexota bacterium]